MSSSIKGWLVAKKTPTQIARAKKEAAEMKRKKNSRGGTKKKALGRNASRGRKMKSYEEDSDFSGDEGADDGFIVDDDADPLELEESEDEAFDSNLEDEEEEEDEEEMVLHDDEDSEDGIDHDTEEIIPVASSRSSRAAARKPSGGKKAKSRIEIEFEEEDEDDEEDDEEIVLYDDKESDDGIDHDTEEIIPVAASRSNRAAARNTRGGKKTTDLLVLHSDDDSDDEPDSFLPNGSHRRSAPSKLLRTKAEAAKKRFNPSLDASMMNADKKKRKQSTESSLMRLKAPALKKPKTKTKPKSSIVAKRESLDDDEDELTSPCHTPNKPMNRGKNSNPKSETNYEEVFSSDEENTINYSNANNKKPRVTLPVKNSKYFNKLNQKSHGQPKETIVLDDSVGDTSDDDEPPNKPQLNNKNISNSLEDTPDPSNKDRRRRLNKNISKIGLNAKGVTNQKANRVTYSINDSSDEDEMVRVDNADDSDDEDMRVAMKLSLKESKKEKKEKKPDEANSRIEMILDDSSDEEDGDQGDAYYDEEKETASNVLRSAEQLSGHVVRAMSSWFGNDGKNSGVVQGIIVDGALALGNIDESKPDNDEESPSNGDGNSHKWISKAVMAKAIPNVTLSGYQLIGVNWMALLNGMTCEVGTKGTKTVNGVLADEMGLGKTVQTIAFLAWLKYHRQTKATEETDDESPLLPHLIVVPLSTLPNWIREFEKFCPEMRVIKYHGSQQEREAMKEDLREHLPKYRNKHVMKRNELDVIVAPVSYFQRENSPDRKFLSNFKFDYLVVDEAHNLKNAKSTRYKMLDKIKTEHRLLLTGTPVQNNPQELLNMLSFIMPLFSKAGSPFEEKDNHTEQMLKHFVDETADHGDEQTAYKKLKQLFAPFVLRRRKDDVIAQLLPQKKRKTVFVELSESTRSIYKSVIQSHFNKSSSTINPATGEHLFTNLRKCAHHPLLLRTRWNTPAEKERLTDCFFKYRAFKGDGCTKERVAEVLESWNDFEVHLTALDLIQENENLREHLGRYTLKQQDLFASSKFENLRSLLPGLISDGHRILVFSSWTSCLDLLGCLLEHLGIQFQRMDGSTHSDERQRLIDLFNADLSISVFLLSTKACGLGINLTSADTCIIHDLDFNPFNDLQAEDRCHRIGQKKPVTVYKLISRDTVDEEIYKMQEKKAKMNAAIMDSTTSRKEKSAIIKSVLEKAKQSGSSDSDEVVI